MKTRFQPLMAAVLAIVLAFGIAIPTLAADLTTEQQTAAAYLKENGIMVGDASGNMLLDQSLTRAEMAVLLARITVNMEYHEAEKAFYAGQCKFTDVPEWARAYVGYCATNYLIRGYGDGRYGPQDPVTPAAACTVMLRCLGDEVGMDWDYGTACQTAVSLGLIPKEATQEAEILRGNMAILMYRTMARMGYDIDLPAEETKPTGLTRNDDGSINLPADGSRYVPATGDVIRCDDGTNYAVTDVSRYDGNMFSSGPAGELPTPTCDWSKLPQPELPAAEARHFTSNGHEYLYARNLYETLRMLYQLYNAIGENPETWANGEPVKWPSGADKVKVSLTVNTDDLYQRVWPLRENDIAEIFNAAPAGTYRFEAWDVYLDGVFQRTEYNIQTDF